MIAAINGAGAAFNAAGLPTVAKLAGALPAGLGGAGASQLSAAARISSQLTGAANLGIWSFLSDTSDNVADRVKSGLTGLGYGATGALAQFAGGPTIAQVADFSLNSIGSFYLGAYPQAWEEAKQLGVPFLGEVPLTISVRETSDEGKPIVATDPDSEIAKAYREIAEQVRRKMRRLRREPAHDLLLPLAAGLRRLPSAATASLVSSLSTGLDIAASNVPGPRSPRWVLGRRISELYSVTEPAARHALRVSAISLEGQLAINLCTDPDALEQVARLADHIEAAFDELVAAAP